MFSYFTFLLNINRPKKSQKSLKLKLASTRIAPKFYKLQTGKKNQLKNGWLPEFCHTHLDRSKVRIQFASREKKFQNGSSTLFWEDITIFWNEKAQNARKLGHCWKFAVWLWNDRRKSSSRHFFLHGCFINSRYVKNFVDPAMLSFGL